MTASLTERQLQVLSLVSHGFSNERIGERLGISTLAARNHVYKILVKLDVSDAPHAVRIGFEDGLLTKSEARAPPRRPAARRPAMKTLTVLATGVVVAVVDLVDICDDRRCKCSAWAAIGAVHWKLRNARPLAEPVPATGRQGLWDIDLPNPEG